MYKGKQIKKIRSIYMQIQKYSKHKKLLKKLKLYMYKDVKRQGIYI